MREQKGNPVGFYLPFNEDVQSSVLFGLCVEDSLLTENDKFEKFT